MRVLPRTKLGTWLLAVAVWSGGCAAACGILPARPRAVWRWPDKFAWPRLTADGRTIVFSNCHDGALDNYGLYSWDSVSDRVTEFADDGVGMDISVSPDGWWAVCHHKGDDRLVLRDLRAGTAVNLPSLDRPGALHRIDFVADGRLLSVLSIWGGNDTLLRVWRLPEVRPVALPRSDMTLSGASHDGSVLALQGRIGDDGPSKYEYVIWDAVRRQVRAELWKPRWAKLYFVPDGSGVVACPTIGWQCTQIWCWRFDGTEPWVAEVRDADEVYGGLVCDNQLAVQAAKPNTDTPGTVAFRDTRDGREFNRLRLAPDEHLENVTSDGRILIFERDASPSPTALGRLLAAVGLGSFIRGEDEQLYFRDAATGAVLGQVRLPPRRIAVAATDAFIPSYEVAGHGGTVAVCDREAQTVFLWDVPPKKPVKWLLIAAAVLAGPTVVLVQRRLRRLQRASPGGGA